MALSPELIKELKDILREEQGFDCDFDTAFKIGHDLAGFGDVEAKIYHEDKDAINQQPI